MRWDQFKQDIQEELEKERDERLAGWEARRAEQEKQEDFGNLGEFSRELNRTLEENPKDSSPMSLSPPDSSGPPTPPDLPRLARHRNRSFSLYGQQQRLKRMLETKHAAESQADLISPSKRLKLQRVDRLASGRLSSGLEMEISDEEDLGGLIREGYYEKAALFTPAPVQVFSVHIPPASLDAHFTRPPTPFPTNPITRGSSPVSADEMHIDTPAEPPITIKVNDGLPDYSKLFESAAEDDQTLDGDDTLPRLAFSSCAEEEGIIDEKLPSPTDTEPIEELLLPRKRDLPKPPVTLRPDHYRQAFDDFVDECARKRNPAVDRYPCFKPHIEALMHERVLYPFTETNRPGPRTDKSIPIRDRKYHPYADLDVHHNIARAERLILVDTRDLTIPPCTVEVPPAVSTVFTVLAPRNSPRSLVYPGLLWPNSFGPLDLPPVIDHTIGDRFESMRRMRKSIVAFIGRVRSMLLPWQIEEIESPLLTLFTIRGRRLFEKKVNRDMFFRILHPTFNPLITRPESNFLRGACYAFRKLQFEQLANSIDHLLRTPQLDIHVCSKLLEMGCLDNDDLEEKAFRFLEEYEDEAQGDHFESDTEEVE